MSNDRSGAALEEVELKLECSEAAWPSPESLNAALGDEFAAQWLRQTQVVDVYLDTIAFDLLRHGFTFRVRGENGHDLLTLKSLQRSGYRDDFMHRLEVEVSLGANCDPQDVRTWPAELQDPVAELINNLGRLAPYLVLRQARDVHGITAALGPASPGPAEHLLAELCLDHVVAHAVALPRPAELAPRSRGHEPGSPVQHTAARDLAGLAEPEPFLTFGLLELEQEAGTEATVFGRLAGQLRRLPGCERVRESKLERTLRALSRRRFGDQGAAVDIAADMSMAEAGRLMWRKQLTAMILNEAGARRGADIEFVHDMRVATRRARSVLILFGDYFRPKAIRPFRRNLRQTAQLLGAIRDLDVALDRLRKYAKSRPAEEQEGLEEIAAHWRARRRDAYRSLLLWLDSSAYRDFVAAFRRFCHTAGAGLLRSTEPDTSPARVRVAHRMPSAILERFEQVRAYDRLLAGDAPDPPLAALHALRIDCKRLRYSLEPVEHLLGPEGTELIGQLKVLQDLLGDLHDAFVAGEWLSGLREAGLASPALDVYADHQLATLHDLARRVPDAWRSFVSAENRRRLALAIARL